MYLYLISIYFLHKNDIINLYIYLYNIIIALHSNKTGKCFVFIDILAKYSNTKILYE